MGPGSTEFDVDQQGGLCMLVVQGMLVTEMWMDRVARMTGQPLHSIRQLNLYKEKEKTHFGQILHGSQIQVAPGLCHFLAFILKAPCSSNEATLYACVLVADVACRNTHQKGFEQMLSLAHQMMQC